MEGDRGEAEARQKLLRWLGMAMLLWPAVILLSSFQMLRSDQTSWYFKAALLFLCFGPVLLLARKRRQLAAAPWPQDGLQSPLAESPGAQPGAASKGSWLVTLVLFAAVWYGWPPVSAQQEPATQTAQQSPEQVAGPTAPDALDEDGYSGLMRAAFDGDMAELERLLKAGAQVDLRQTVNEAQRGDTALLRAFYGGQLAAAQRLVAAGASLKARNRWDWGPVHMAAQSGCLDCLQWLAGQGQSLTEAAPASRGETPAMLAAVRNQQQVLKWLAAQGVDLDARDPHGKTALDWARWAQAADTERWLKQRLRERR